MSSGCKYENFSSRWISRVEFYYSLWPGELGLLHLLCHPRVKPFIWSSNHSVASYSCTLYSDHHSTLASNDSFNPKNPFYSLSIYFVLLEQVEQQLREAGENSLSSLIPLPFSPKGPLQKMHAEIFRMVMSLQKFRELHCLQGVCVLCCIPSLVSTQLLLLCCLLLGPSGQVLWKVE